MVQPLRKERGVLMRALVVTAVLLISGSALAQSTGVPPATVKNELPQLKQIDRFALLPAAIQKGDFSVDGASARGWQMAEPGARFSATDVPVPGAPGRRLIFAACDSTFCLIHYERGGIAHFYEILALSNRSREWQVVWNVRGRKPLASLNALRARLRSGTLGPNWDLPAVRRDF